MRTFLALALLWIPPPAEAAEDRVPLVESFSPLELGAIGGLVLANALSLAFEAEIAAAREPAIGDPWSWDREISDALWRGPEAALAGRWLGGVPDDVGYVVAPLAAFGFYGVETAWLYASGRSATGDRNADHELLALAEAYGATMLTTQLAKLGIGRERPLWALDRAPPGTPRDEEATLSFFSGHSSSSFCLASFVWRDLSDWLVAERLADASSAARLWAGRVLPAVVLYGAAGTVALSRIIDRKHYFSDVVVGSAVGAAFGHLFYALHFDGTGRPRRRRSSVGVLPVAGGLGVAGRF